MLHTWIKQTLNLTSSSEAKDFIEDWIEDKHINLFNRVSNISVEIEFKQKDFKPEIITPIDPIPQEILKEIYSNFDTSIDTLKRLVWCTEDQIEGEVLRDYEVAYWPEKGSIILPHHNVNGEIIGIYERSFKPLRKQIKKLYPDMPYSQMIEYPRAKYVPMLRDPQYQTEEKTSWSFPNSQNLYGLHLAKSAIKETGKAIIFEGGKSVMLARQYGYPYAVASHTFGAHLNHISMLIEAGAKEIILSFDKQYRDQLGSDWELYEHKTRELAEKVQNYVSVSRLIDRENRIGFKDSPIDNGRSTFIEIFNGRENLTNRGDSIGNNIPDERQLHKNHIQRQLSDYDKSLIEKGGSDEAYEYYANF